MAGVRIGTALSPGWFAFVAGWTLRRAFRCREYTSFITIGVSRECIGWSVCAGSDAHLEFTAAIAPLLRQTDLFGEIDDETFAILLSDADEAAGCRVVRRLAEPLGSVRFSAPLVFVIGAATSPTDGVDVPALLAHAASHPVLSLRPQLVSADPLSQHPEAPRLLSGLLHHMEEQA